MGLGSWQHDHKNQCTLRQYRVHINVTVDSPAKSEDLFYCLRKLCVVFQYYLAQKKKSLTVLAKWFCAALLLLLYLEIKVVQWHLFMLICFKPKYSTRDHLIWSAPHKIYQPFLSQTILWATEQIMKDTLQPWLEEYKGWWTYHSF